VNTRHLPKAGALPDCATPRMELTHCIYFGFLTFRRALGVRENGVFGTKTRKNGTRSGTRFALRIRRNPSDHPAQQLDCRIGRHPRYRPGNDFHRRRNRLADRRQPSFDHLEFAVGAGHLASNTGGGGQIIAPRAGFVWGHPRRKVVGEAFGFLEIRRPTGATPPPAAAVMPVQPPSAIAPISARGHQPVTPAEQKNRLTRNKPRHSRPPIGAIKNGTRLSAAQLFLSAALVFDPHVLWLAWSAERQETVAATSRATCEAAATAIREGRWLADDPPAAVRCERGNAFAPGSDCIAGHNCGARR